MEKEKLFEMAGEVYRNVPAYVNYLLDKSVDINEITEFEDFPIIDKSVLLANQHACISPEYIMDSINGKLWGSRTSGSTGRYIEVLWNKSDYFKSLIELWMRRTEYYGIYPDNRMMFFFARVSGDDMVIYEQNNIGICKDMLNADGLEYICRQISEYKPEWLMLQPSSADLLCNYIIEHNIDIPDSVRYIEFSGELLTDRVRRLTKDVFRCSIANQYGTNEVETIAYECPHGAMHIMNSNVYVEIVDDIGRNVSGTGEGNIVVTSKTNKVMPFIRYKIGDKGCLNVHKCDCGNKAPILELTSARPSDFVITKGGDRVSPYIFVSIFNAINSTLDGTIKQFYVEQSDIDKFKVHLYADEEDDADYIQTTFKEQLYNILKYKYMIEFYYEDDYFHIDDNLKYIYFRSRI